MKKLLSKGKMVALAAGIVSAAQVASAVQVNYTYTGETGGGVGMTIHTASGSENALVGQFVMTTSNPNFSSTLLTYCTDVSRHAGHRFFRLQLHPDRPVRRNRCGTGVDQWRHPKCSQALV